MTGATSELGAPAIQHIAAQPRTRIMIGARGRAPTAPPGVEVISLHLASLTSVREFANIVMARLLIPHMADHGRLVITTSDERNA